ncbi:MAG TPA: hypothetical protein VMU50_04325, partial [Polyangia bacterium]|nr:hypothetical protein [Polyangia bacterium]
VEAATQKEINDRDSNDNIIDRITGKEVHKPGEERPQDIVVPSPSSRPAAPESTTPPPVAAPPIERVNTEPAKPAPAPAAGKPSKAKGKKSGAADGLDL